MGPNDRDDELTERVLAMRRRDRQRMEGFLESLERESIEASERNPYTYG